MNRRIALTLLAFFTFAGVNGAIWSAGSGGGSTAALAGPLANKTIEAKLNFSLPLPCVVINWHFIINQITDPSQAPATITVYWSTGGSQVVPLDKVTGGTAQYNVAPPSGSAYPTRVTASIYDAWDGIFTYSHLNCEATPTPTQTNTPVATSTPIVTATQAANTATPTATAWAESTATPTATQAANTPTPTATQPASTATPTATARAESTATATPTQPSSTATPTATTQPTNTATPIPTAVGGVEVTPTPTATNQPDNTATPAPTAVAGVAITPTSVAVETVPEKILVQEEIDTPEEAVDTPQVVEAAAPAEQPRPTALPKAGDTPLGFQLIALLGLVFVTLGIGIRRLVR